MQRHTRWVSNHRRCEKTLWRVPGTLPPPVPSVSKSCPPASGFEAGFQPSLIHDTKRGDHAKASGPVHDSLPQCGHRLRLKGNRPCAWVRRNYCRFALQSFLTFYSLFALRRYQGRIFVDASWHTFNFRKTREYSPHLRSRLQHRRVPLRSSGTLPSRQH